MNFACSGKNAWPEFVGCKGSEAAKKIQRDYRRLRVVVLREGTYVTHDFWCSRVRIWVDAHGIVVQVPHVG